MDSLTRSSEKFQALLDSVLFKTYTHSFSIEDKVQLSIAKARSIAATSRITLDDITHLSPRFWDLHREPIVCRDGATTTLLTIQYNLTCNIETTATTLPNSGGFLLHTPHIGAAKYMPPTVPCGIPCTAIVMARLIDQAGVDNGIKPFLVSINDGKVMFPGISARLLPPRGGANPVLHSITLFNARDAPGDPTSSPDSDKRLGYLMSIWRAAIGSLCLSATMIPGLAKSAFMVVMYGRRRRVGTAPSVPIITFKPQYAPILTAFAQSFTFYHAATKIFRDHRVDFRVRHGVAACFKAVALRHMQDANLALSERCGAQGLCNYNEISELHANMRGIAIAEGDILGLSIRLATELILNRYLLRLDSEERTHSPLWLHAEGLISACRSELHDFENHRSAEFNRYILPHCQPIVETLGMALAYEAAVDAGLDESITKLYLATAMRHDEAWYIEHMQLGQKALFDAEEDALACALPKLDKWMEMPGVGEYVSAPIVSTERWLSFVSQLEVFSPSRLVDHSSRLSHL
ncbi:hypothetical protein B0H10DRAFT_2172852 [Mycena sp. CBHHK59/15]|nr:hypothetical protein B0H10DRAFT_2172852 [Mycena sp. CBHHK59/15]